MHLGVWRTRLLIILGLLLVALPVIGLPLLVKNILVAASGLFIITVILIAADHKLETKPETGSTVSEVVKEKEVEALPLASYQKSAPEFYADPALVPSPIKPKTVRRRTIKSAKIKSVSEHAHTV